MSATRRELPPLKVFEQASSMHPYEATTASPRTRMSRISTTQLGVSAEQATGQGIFRSKQTRLWCRGCDEFRLNGKHRQYSEDAWEVAMGPDDAKTANEISGMS